MKASMRTNKTALQTWVMMVGLIALLIVVTISLAILLLIFTSGKTFGVNNSQTQLYQLATSYGEALQTININNWHNLVLEQDDFTELYNSTAPNSSKSPNKDARKL